MNSTSPPLIAAPNFQACLSSFWTASGVLFGYYLYELLVTRQLCSKTHEHPLVGTSSSLAPRCILNLVYAFRGVKIIEEGYKKFRSSTFKLIRNDGSVVFLPNSMIEELSSLPPNIASPHEALEHDLLGPYTGLRLILESRLHHSIVQRKLTPRLGLLAPDLQHELSAAFEGNFPSCDDWTDIQPYQIFSKLSARLSARALVGPALCRNKTWLDISVSYTESLFRTIVILRMFPGWTHSWLSKLLPSYWAGKRYVSKAKSLLGPRINDLLQRGNAGKWSPDSENKDEANVLAWLADTAKGADRDPETLAHVEVLLALASVHTTLLRMVNVLYDLMDSPQYFQELREEIGEVNAAEWSINSYSKLTKLDSVMRESQRLSPPTTLGMKRLFKADYRFDNGLSISKGTYVCMPTFAIENDSDNTVDPKKFDGLRSWRFRQRKEESEDHQFVSAEPTVLNFGYGKSACPGRFFASLIIKMLFVKLLTEYEFRFLENKGRPKNLVVHEFLFPWPWDTVQVRRRQGELCPF